MKLAATTAKVDLSDWEIPALSNAIKDKILREIILNAASEALQSAFESKGRAFFPIFYSYIGEPTDGLHGPRVTDPAILYVGVPDIGGDLEEAYFSINLRDAVEFYIEDIDDEQRDAATKLAAMFREFAEMIDRKLED